MSVAVVVVVGHRTNAMVRLIVTFSQITNVTVHVLSHDITVSRYARTEKYLLRELPMFAP